jgi:predicted ATPase
MIPRIVITGAPSSGKTEFFERLKSHPALAGFLFFDELARQLLTEKPHYRDNWSTFHIELYHRQAAREKQAHDRPFITDRGTADAFAFHPEAMSEVGTTLEREHQRYSAVVQLGTSAALGERFYRRDSIRNEPAAKTLEIEEEIKKVWCRQPGYHFVDAEIDFEKKFRTFLKLVLKLIRIGG